MFSLRSTTVLIGSIIFVRVTDVGAQSHRISAQSVLNGKHLIVSGVNGPFDLRVMRNASGYIVKYGGIASMMLAWLTEHYNFTYSPFQTDFNQLDSIGNRTGLMPLVSQGVCDIVTTATPTTYRSMFGDFTHPAIYIPAAYVIPPSDTSFNVFALIQPFQLWVWIGILITSLAVTFVLYGLITHDRLTPSKSLDHGIKTGLAKRIDIIYIFVFGILLNQSGHSLGRRMPVVLTTGAWCLVAFILVNAYTTLLISFIAAPISRPLISSIYELRNRPDIRLVSNRERNTAAVILSMEQGFFKELGDRLRADPKALCTTSVECVNMVKEGNTVYTAGREGTLYAAIAEDMRTTGKCNLELGDETFINLSLAWGVQKRSPYADPINMGFFRMRQAGLVDKWYKEHQPDISLCVGKRRKDQAKKLRPLSLKNFFGTFVILVMGYAVGITFFVGEALRACHRKQY